MHEMAYVKSICSSSKLQLEALFYLFISFFQINISESAFLHIHKVAIIPCALQIVVNIKLNNIYSVRLETI